MSDYYWSLKVKPGRKGFDPSQLRIPAGQSGGGRWTSRGIGGGDWDMDTDNPENYHPFVKGIYDALPTAAKEGVSPPRIIVDESSADAMMQFASIRMGLAGIEPNPYTGKVSKEAKRRIGTVFVHEYAHYMDYRKQLSDTPEFDRIFQSSIEHANMALSSIDSIKNPQAQEQMRMMTEILDGKATFDSYPVGYLERGNNRKQELLAVGMANWEYYNPVLWKQLPELRGYFAKNFPHPGGD